MSSSKLHGMRCLGLVAVAGCFAGSVATPVPPTAEAIVRDTVAMYASVASYADRGDLATTFHGNTMDRIDDDHRTFETAFVRGGRFRFDVVAAGSPYTVWNDGKHTYSRWRHSAGPGIHMEPDVVTALREAEAVSNGVSLAIPSVLLRGDAGASWLTTLRLRIDGTEPIDGAPCWRLNGLTAHDETIALWIDQRTHAIRRVVEHHRNRSFEAVATATFAPIVGQPVDPAKLATPLPDGPELPWIGVAFGEGGKTRIRYVIEGSPAARAKLVAGDEIAAIDGEPTPSASDVASRVVQARIGARPILTIRRGGATLDVVVVIENRPYLEQLARERLLDKPAPDFALPVVTGTYPATRADLAGKVIVLAFGSRGCASCTAAIPQLNTWQTTYGARGLRIVFVSGDELATITDYARYNQVGFTVARDADDKLAIAYLRTELPALVVIDKRGIVRRVDAYAETDDIETAIIELLK